MSNPLTPVDLNTLEAVTGGTTTTPSSTATPRCSGGSNDLLNTLNSISSTIKDLSNTSTNTGFSTTQILMLGLLMNQNRQVNVYVRRPYW
jgi:hypothetical protein